MKIVLIGATGQVGGDLIRNHAGHDIVAPDRGALDLSRPAQVSEYIAAQRPDAVINCAAFHNVPLCEDEPEQAFRINCIAVRDLAAACAINGAWFVTFSTNYVFGGDKREPYLEDDCPRPLQVYGISRLAGELTALATLPERAVVIRTSALFGISGSASRAGNFVEARIADARRGALIEMSSEQTISTTSTHDLGRAVLSLIVHPQLRPGIYHLVNDGACTWFEFTRAIMDLLELKTEVRPVDRGGRSGNMRRPLYSALGNTKARALGITLRPWREALAEYLAVKYPESFHGQSGRGGG